MGFLFLNFWGQLLISFKTYRKFNFSIYLFVYLFVYLFIYLFIFVFSRAAPTAYGGSQARGPTGAVAAGLHHSHSNVGSEPRLRPTPQLMATLDP